VLPRRICDAEFFENILRDRFHRRDRAHGHEHRSFDLAMRREQASGAGRAARVSTWNSMDILAIVATAMGDQRLVVRGQQSDQSSPRTLPSSRSLPTLTGSLNRRGPALPGLK
jgi:hypothetical protein